jgi:hypothetical protein
VALATRVALGAANFGASPVVELRAVTAVFNDFVIALSLVANPKSASTRMAPGSIHGETRAVLRCRRGRRQLSAWLAFVWY